MRLLFALIIYAFYIQALGGLAAPFLAAEFELDDAAITAITAGSRSARSAPQR